MRGLTLEQAQAWATLVALYGGVTMTGDNLNMNDPRAHEALYPVHAQHRTHGPAAGPLRRADANKAPRCSPASGR